MKKNLIILVLCFFAFGLGAGLNNIAFSDIDASKVAYVDVAQLISSSKTIKQAQATREKQTTEMLKWYDKANAEIQKQETKEKKQTLIKKYEAQLTQKKKSIREAYSKEMQKAGTQIETVIAEKAKELGYGLVFKKESLIFGGSDITSKIVPLVK